MHIAYISGPFTAGNGRTVEENIAAAVVLGQKIRRLGIAPLVPHKSILDPGPGETGYKLAMRECLEQLRRCDSIVMMENWEESRGARIEKWVAERWFKKPVWFAFDTPLGLSVARVIETLSDGSGFVEVLE